MQGPDDPGSSAVGARSESKVISPEHPQFQPTKKVTEPDAREIALPTAGLHRRQMAQTVQNATEKGPL